MLHKILVVDNENLIGDTCRLALGDLGYEVFCATAEEAPAIASREGIDLAIVDAGVQEMTGVRTFQEMRKVLPALAGILITGETSFELVIDAMNKGFGRICHKPLDLKNLVEAVSETVKIADLRAEVSRMKVLLPLYDLGQKFMAAESEQAIYEDLVNAVCRGVNVSSVSVMMFDVVAGTLKVVAYRGLFPELVENLQIRPGEQIAGRVFQSERSIVLNRVNQHLNPYYEQMHRQELSAAISFPIVSQGRVLGVLNISESREGMQFREADLELLSIIVNQAMMALENLRSIRAREEMSRIRALLEQYVSPEVSSLLVKNNRDLLDIGGVQHLTVLFADIRNFTALVQHLPPERLRVFLNGFFEKFAGVVFSHQGMLDKFMGDGALVVFGAPVHLDNPNAAAVSAARQIMAEFEGFRALSEKQDMIFAKVGLGIGISRGPMFLGNVGSSKRLDYTVIGADVNIAQRLAAMADSGQILITDRVQATLDGAFPAGTQKSMQLRGIDAEVSVYSLPAVSLPAQGARRRSPDK